MVETRLVCSAGGPQSTVRPAQAAAKLSVKFSDQVDTLFTDTYPTQNIYELKHDFLDVLDSIQDQLPHIATNFTNSEINELFQILVIELDSSNQQLPRVFDLILHKIKTHHAEQAIVMSLGFMEYLRQRLRVEEELYSDEVFAGATTTGE